MCAATPGTCFSSLGADRMPGQRQNRYEYPTNPALLQACLLLSLREQWRSDRFVPLHVCLTFIKYAYQCYVCRSFYYCLDYDVSRVEFVVRWTNVADDEAFVAELQIFATSIVADYEWTVHLNWIKDLRKVVMFQTDIQQETMVNGFRYDVRYLRGLVRNDSKMIRVSIM